MEERSMMPATHKVTHRIYRTYERTELEKTLNILEAECDGVTKFMFTEVTPLALGQDVVYIAHVTIHEEVSDADNI